MINKFIKLYMCHVHSNLSYQMQFPQTICDYERINYSINIEDINIKTQHHYGPYQHYGSAAKSHTIASGLEEDKEYTLIVVVNTRTGDILSQRYNFSKKLLRKLFSF